MKRQPGILAIVLFGLAILVTLGGAPPDAFPQSAQAAAPIEMTLQLVGYLGGESRAVCVQGNYAYAALGQELAVLNIASPAQPIRVGSLVFPDAMYQVQVVGNYAYLLGMRNTAAHLWVVNVSNPAQPTQAAKYDLAPGIAHGEQTTALYISGNYGYVTSEGSTFSGLRVLNLSNPSAPTFMGALNTNPLRPNRIFVAGQYAYLTGDAGASDSNGLRVVNVAQPAAPQPVGSLGLAGFISGIFVSGNYAFLTDYDLGKLRAVNISNPTQPQEVMSVDVFLGTPYETSDIFISGNYAYIAGAARSGSQIWGGVEIRNVSDPANQLSLVGGYATSAIHDPLDVFFAGNHVFLAAGGDGLWTINVSDPAHPTLAGRARVLEDPEGVCVSGNPSLVPERRANSNRASAPALRLGSGQAYAYIADWGLKVVDITNGALPAIVGVYTASPPIVAGGLVDVSGAHVYLTNQQGWLRVLDVSQPNSPSVVGQYNGGASDLDVVGNYAYLVDGNLRVVDISIPANPTQIGSFNASGSAAAVAVSGNYAYLGGYSSGLRVLNVSDPANPTQASSMLTPLSVYDVVVSGAYAYLTTNNDLRVVDVSNPASPTQVGSTLPYSTINAVSGNYGFGITQSGLKIWDLSNPISPTVLFTYTTPTLLNGVHANGEYVYATGDGMFILRLAPLALQATPTALTFMAQVGGANPTPRGVSVTSNGRALNWSANINPAAGWLSVAPTSGVTSSNITITPNIAGLPIGQYQTQLVVQASDSVQGNPQTIPITLLVVQTLNNLNLPLILR